MQDGERVACLGIEKLGQMKAALLWTWRSEPGGGGGSQMAASLWEELSTVQSGL